MRAFVAVLALLGATEAAHAAACKGLADRVGTLALEELAPTYAALARCDANLAAEKFPEFMRRSSEAEALVALSVAAIDAGVGAPVRTMLERITDYGARDEVAKGIGAACSDTPAVVAFLHDAYTSLGERQFTAWREAFAACSAPEHVAWLGEVAAAPADVPYDEKYDIVARSLVDHLGADALPALEKAAVKAGQSGGPFTAVLDRMGDAVRPATFGGEPSPEDRQKLEEALVRVAGVVPPEPARLVADRLYQSGADAAAAKLLPRAFPDRVQEGGAFLYGVASVENCGGQAVVHYAVASEPGTRWSVLDDLQAPARAFKPRLKCTTEGDWPVVTTREPLVSAADVEAWSQKVVAEWAAKGLTVKARAEKPIALR